MNIQVPTAILDGSVLSLLEKEDTYGYIITKTMQDLFQVSDSTMYPVLRRLKKDEYLETYDEPFEGRIRRYYKITEKGKQRLDEIKNDWQLFNKSANELLGGKK
ncbi:MAG: PadR family transcriptional regulator [Lactobacillaceae bacterium]|jgi:PadR family transcriptional regulator PadR|nr:PadR family transcriptional regulator [Lactobacillaceae bacterium]